MALFKRPRPLRRSPPARYKHPTNCKPRLERLERRALLAAEVLISEFMASNGSSLADGNGQFNDWVELHNAGDESADLSGWHLSDDPTGATRWTFPSGASSVLTAGDFLVVFASGDAVPDAMGNLHTNFQLAASGEYLSLTRADDSLVSEFGSDNSDYPTQYADISYGIDSTINAGNPKRYFLTPTPGTANSDPIAGFVGDTAFSVDRGYFTESFSVEITSPTIEATLVYTTDGSEPTLVNGTQVIAPTGNSPLVNILISTTTTLRAAAFKSGYQPTNVDTQTYLFLNDVIDQPASPAGFPTGWGAAPAADYEMDPEVTDDLNYTTDLLSGLRELPALSLVSDVESIFGANGIYSNPTNGSLEVPVSAEYILPDGSTGFQIDAGLKVAGGASRNPDNSPKHSMSLRFRNAYGSSKLEYDLFDGSPVDEFNSLQLRALYNNSWIHWDQGQRSRGTLIRDQFVRDSLIAAGQDDAGHGHYSHVYINGLYWGVYNLHERADSSHFAQHNGGDADDYDALNGGSPIDGTAASWNNVKAVAESGDWAAVQQVLDVDNFIDWTLVQAYGGNADLKVNGNWRAAGGGTAAAPWRMYAWDSERILEGVTAKPPDTITDATGMFDDLMQIPEFVVRLGDRIQQHFTGNGAFTPEKSIERWNARATELQNAIVAESARWGDYRRDVHPRGATPLLYRRDQTWTPEIERVTTQYFPLRTDFVFDQFVSLGWMPSDAAPEFRINGAVNFGGTISAGSSLRMIADTDTVYYTTDGTDPRLKGGEISSSASVYDASVVSSTLLNAGADWKFEDSGIDLGTVWLTNQYDDSNWDSGPAQLGFGDGDESTIVSFGSDASQKNRTTYFRNTFDVPTTDWTQVKLRIRRDDGAVVYLNETEVARDNLPTGTISYSTRALQAAPDDGNDWIEFDLPQGLLQTGSNILAVEIHQNSPTSSDLSFDAELIGVTQTASPIVMEDSIDIRARSYDGNGNWSALQNTLFVVPNIPATSANLRMTEIHFDPATDGDAEFIELRNITTGDNGVILDLDGVTLTDGPSLPFTIAPNTRLLPGESALLVRDTLAFSAAYPNVPAEKIVGQYDGKLSNGGERIRIIGSNGAEIADVTYRDSDPWPKWAEGIGGSLVLRDPIGVPVNELGKPYSYRGSTEIGGSPESTERPSSGVIINEVLTHTDNPLSDSIEIYNPTSSPINLGGWYLSDSGSVREKYRIPAGTTIDSGAYLVFDESDFNPPLPNANSLQPFALSGSEGDSAWLFEGDATGTTAFADHVSFDATFNGISLGRIKGSGGRLVPLANRSLGTINGMFRTSDLVISEINYHPDDPTPAALAILPGMTVGDLEFIEVTNATNNVISLTDWRLRGEVDHDFSAGQSLAAAEAIVLVSFDPDSLLNTDLANAFRTHYAIGPGVQLAGPFSDSLSNSYGIVKLQAPDAPPADTPTLTPRVTVDEVLYDDLAPWPTAADGTGASLQRIAPSTLGTYVDSWRGETPTPGNVPVRPTVDSVIINEGSTSRSSVTRLDVRFDSEIDFSAGAFIIRNRTSGQIVEDLQLAAHVKSGKTEVVITFGNAPLVVQRTTVANSLADGNYELQIVANKIRSVGTDTAMALDYRVGQAASDGFFRLFGDIDGDRGVDAQDYGQFGLSFLRSTADANFRSDLDYEGDGDIDSQDFSQFRRRFMRRLSD